MRLTYEKGISDTVPKILRQNQVVGKKPITITLNDKSKSEKYYVYGMGELVAIYDKAAYAIQRADLSHYKDAIYVHLNFQNRFTVNSGILLINHRDCTSIKFQISESLINFS